LWHDRQVAEQYDDRDDRQRNTNDTLRPRPVSGLIKLVECEAGECNEDQQHYR
jgi:hypothetical protein